MSLKIIPLSKVVQNTKKAEALLFEKCERFLIFLCFIFLASLDTKLTVEIIGLFSDQKYYYYFENLNIFASGSLMRAGGIWS